VRIDFVITLIAVFVSVALVSGSLASLALSLAAPERKRVRMLTASRSSSARPAHLRLTEAPSATVKRLLRVLPGASRDAPALRRRLTAAGYEQYAAVVLYSAAQLALPVVLGLIPLLVVGVGAGWAPALALVVLGFLVPDLVLTHMVEEHKKAIQNGLPDALDLIVICVEAGCSLDQAILKASNELEIAQPAIGRELRTVSAEVRAGKPRLEAFQDLAKRTGVEDVKALVAMLIQTDRFGTSIAQSLRTHADTSRTKRRQRAEERAGTVGVKLVFPLVLCLIPALYVVCLGPAVVSIYRNLF
jgi:tight adherence protein C